MARGIKAIADEYADLYMMQRDTKERLDELKTILIEQMETGEKIEAANGKTVSKQMANNIIVDDEFEAYLKHAGYWQKVIEEKVSIPKVKALVKVNGEGNKLQERIRYTEVPKIVVR